MKVIISARPMSVSITPVFVKRFTTREDFLDAVREKIMEKISDISNFDIDAGDIVELVNMYERYGNETGD